MRADPVAERIHRALGLPPPAAEQLKRPRPDPIVRLAKRIDELAEDWLRGRPVREDALRGATFGDIVEALGLLTQVDARRRAR